MKARMLITLRVEIEGNHNDQIIIESAINLERNALIYVHEQIERIKNSPFLAIRHSKYKICHNYKFIIFQSKLF